MPRTYGAGILWWMDASGVLDERFDEVPDLLRARPSMQLIGSPGRTVDLNALGRLGVRIVGRFAGVRDGQAQFAGSLPNVSAGRPQTGPAAGQPRRLGRAGRGGRRAAAPVRSDRAAGRRTVRAVGAAGIGSIVWATGYRPDLSWLDVDVFDRRGRVVHDGGVTAAPGLYLMGMPFLRRRRSTLIDGAGADAHELARHLADHLDGPAHLRAGHIAAVH